MPQPQIATLQLCLCASLLREATREVFSLRLTNGTSARDRKTSLGAQITDGTVIGTGIAKYDCAARGKTSKQDYFALGLSFTFATHLIGIDPRKGFRWIAGLSWPPHGVYPGVLFGQLYVNTITHIQIQLHKCKCWSATSW